MTNDFIIKLIAQCCYFYEVNVVGGFQRTEMEPSEPSTCHTEISP